MAQNSQKELVVMVEPTREKYIGQIIALSAGTDHPVTRKDLEFVSTFDLGRVARELACKVKGAKDATAAVISANVLGGNPSLSPTAPAVSTSARKNFPAPPPVLLAPPDAQ